MTEDDAFTMPTRAELGVLIALWRHGSTPATGRDVIEHHDDCPAHPTVMNLLRHLHDKGVVTKTPGDYGNLFTAVYSCEQVIQRILASLIDRFFGGDCAKLVAYAQAHQQQLSCRDSDCPAEPFDYGKPHRSQRHTRKPMI